MDEEENKNKAKAMDETTTIGSVVLHDDDSSWISKSSVDSVLKNFLKESDPIDDIMVIDYDNDVLDALVEPLEDVEAEDEVQEDSANQNPEGGKLSVDTTGGVISHSSQPVSTMQAESAYHDQHITTSASQDSASSGGEHTIVSLDENEISSLLKGDLLEPPQLMRPVTPNDSRLATPPGWAGGGGGGGGDIIYSVMCCLHHLERDGHVKSQADSIVRECQYYHGQGDKRYQDLPRSIFDRLVQLLGVHKFNEIYHRAHHYVDPRSYHHDNALRDPHRFAVLPAGAQHHGGGPNIMQLAIAYGIHLARSSANGSEAPIQLVQHGVATLNSMSPKERGMFWQYMTQTTNANGKKKP